MLPIHPQPIKDEILSSWMTRLAISNQLPIHTFYNCLLNYKGNIWNRDIDRAPKEGLLGCLSQETGQAQPRLVGMTLFCLQGYFLMALNPFGISKWILPIGVYHRERSRPGIQYCPACLEESEKPYLKLSWRLSFIVSCPKHRCLLRQACPYCGSPVEVHRLAMGRNTNIADASFKHCYCCKNKLTDIDVTPVSFIDSALSQRFFDSQSLETIDRILPEKAVFPCQFLEAARMLIVMISKKRHSFLRNWLGRQIGMNLAHYERLANFDFAVVKTRFWFWSAVCWLTGDWPNRILRANREVGINRSMISHDHGDIPYWLDNVALSNFDKKQYSYNDEELKSLSDFLDFYQVRKRPCDLCGGYNQSIKAADELYKTWLSINHQIEKGH